VANGVAERWVGNCRRDLLDHAIVLNERHLKRLMSEYVQYYHEDRTHLALAKRTPTAVKQRALRSRKQNHSDARLGGLHHRYDLAAELLSRTFRIGVKEILRRGVSADLS